PVAVRSRVVPRSRGDAGMQAGPRPFSNRPAFPETEAILMLSIRKKLLVGASLALIALSSQAKEYGPGASDTEIKIGNTMPYSGPASAYGTIGKAHAAYFKMINDQGGINGRKINYISLDDGYSPPTAVEQTRKLVEQDEVLLLMAQLGTPSN